MQGKTRMFHAEELSARSRSLVTASLVTFSCGSVFAAETIHDDQSTSRNYVSAEYIAILDGNSYDTGTVDLLAIGGTRVRAIGGTRVRADDSADTQAIGGTRVRAIGGTRVRAIGGTRVRSKSLGYSDYLRVLFGEHSMGLLLSGPVESVEPAAGIITLLGQQLEVDPDSLIGLAPGRVLTVMGCAVDRGVVIDTDEQFVSGATETMFIGDVVYSDSTIGRIVVGNIEIDYTALPSNRPIPQIKMGDIVLVRGTLY